MRWFPRPGKARTDFNSTAKDEPEPVHSMMDAATLVAFKVKWRILEHIELVPARGNIVHIHCPGYYAYPFIIGYTLPVPSLATNFYRFYEVCPAQLTPYIYKLFLMLTKYAELDNRGVSLQHLLHIFVPSFHRGTVLHLRHRGTKSLLIGMDNKTNRRFWESFFYVRME